MNTRIFRLLAMLLVLIIVTSTAVVFYNDKSSTPPSWPYNATKAPDVSLAFAWSRMTGQTLRTEDPGPGWLIDALPIGKIDEKKALIIAELPSGPPLRAGVLDRHLHLDFGDGHYVKAQMPFPSSGVVQDLLGSSMVDLVVYENAQFEATLSDRLFQILPIIILVGLLILLMGRGATKGLGLTSAYTLVPPSSLTESFKDVAGIDQAQEDLEGIVAFLKDPEAAGRLGGRMPKGILFAGPPGTGKTLLARALAKEAGVPFLAIEASGVTQIFVGAGAMKIRRAFREARKRAPCIVFIDEIDALGRARSSGGSGGGSDEKDTTLNALLVELDGLESRAGVVLVAATNRPDVLDPALIRRGRIDRRIDVHLPSLEDRQAILRVHMAKVKTDIALADIVARDTFGLAGADLAALVNEAALAATQRGANAVELVDYRAARDRLIIGQGSSVVRLSEKERYIVAVHEAGHALVAAMTKDSDPIERVTIVPQGSALGFVMQRITEDRRLATKSQLEAKIDVAFGGRMAEIALLPPGSETSGAESDVAMATRIASSMAGLWGMSELGCIRLEAGSALIGDGQSMTRAVTKILEESRQRVFNLIDEHKEAVSALAAHLIENETIDGAEALKIMERAGARYVGVGQQAPVSGTHTTEKMT